MANAAELRTRVGVGALLIALVSGMLFFDPGPWYPFLAALLVLLAAVACHETALLFPEHVRPPRGFLIPAVLVLLAANWTPQFLPGDAWDHLLAAFTVCVLAAFLIEMARFREPGVAVPRLALTVFTLAYLGILPAFLAQLRWWPAPAETSSPDPRGAAALALTIFVPKACDIGAYFTGRFLGRHKMSPVLSPKKTYEGLAGGLALSGLTAVGLNEWVPILPCRWSALGFGVAVGFAGVLGDLAESFLKRDSQKKDASHVVPGFGGVLDVIDSLLFAAPVAYFWLRVLPPAWGGGAP